MIGSSNESQHSLISFLIHGRDDLQWNPREVQQVPRGLINGSVKRKILSQKTIIDEKEKRYENIKNDTGFHRCIAGRYPLQKRASAGDVVI